MILKLENNTQAIKVTQENLDICARFAKITDNYDTFIKCKEDVLEIITRATAFRVYPGQWLLRRENCLFKLMQMEFDNIYKYSSK